ncbi:MAG TPA: DUF3348 family protein, partial [Variovorax sp.]
AALDGAPAGAPSAARPSGIAEERECARVRTALAQTIATTPMETSTDFAPHRRRYLASQQMMETRIGPLRERLQTRLAARSPALARLAAVDAVMAQSLAVHEQRLLATLPGMLEKHFKRLRQAEAKAQDDPDSGAEADRWLKVFGKDTQALLLAELDLRFQPLDGLLEALRPR